jgi:hypothetical protein
MGVVNWPTDIRIGSFDAGVEYNVQINTFRNGSIQTYGLPGGRWVVAVGFESEVEQMQRPKIEALIVDLEGGANRLLMHHHGRPLPNGSLRGAPVLNANAPQGSKSVVLATVNGTLLRGDIIGILGQSVMVTADTAPSGGTMTVNFKPALRNFVPIGTAVVWNKPSAYYIPRSPIAGPFPFRQGGVRPGFSVDFVEHF